MEKINEIVPSGNNKPGKYKLLKIEKLGKDAMKLVLNSVKAGRPYTVIAKLLTETYNKNITERDVSAVLSSNAQLMERCKNQLDKYQLDRANLVLNESTVLVDDMERLDKVSTELENRMRNSIATKDLVEIAKGLTDLSRTRSAMIRNYKRLTGQSKEKPNVLIDNSKKEVHVTTNSETSNKLAKELAQAQFKEEPKKIPETKDNIVDAEFEEQAKEEE